MKLDDLRGMFKPGAPKPAPVKQTRSVGGDRLIDVDWSRYDSKGKGRAMGRAVVGRTAVITLNGMLKWDRVQPKLITAAVRLGWPSDIRIQRVSARSGIVRKDDDIRIVNGRHHRSIEFTSEGAHYGRAITYTIPEP